MSQPLNLRRSAQIVRRYKILLGVAVILGLLAGGAYATLNPPVLSSSALLVLPSISAANMATQVVVAGSDPVLSAALPHIGGGVTLQQLHDDVSVESLTPNVISVTATSKKGEQAERIANAVADSYLAYVGATTSPVGHVAARMLQSANNATGTTAVKKTALYALLGALVGAVIGFIVALGIGRNGRRLRERDEIANSIGVPVVASLPVDHPSDTSGWTKLLESYEPKMVHAWRLRKALQQFGVVTAALGGPDSGVTSVAVVSFSWDRGALALGPQLATFAASLGIPTVLFIGPQPDSKAIAALRTACAASLPQSQRSRFLRIIVSEDGMVERQPGAALVVVVAAIDSRTPQMPEMPRTGITLLGVSAGAASAEELARAATVAADDGRDVTGILVADPDPADQTTGRIPQLVRSAQRRVPTRVEGIPTEIKR